MKGISSAILLLVGSLQLQSLGVAAQRPCATRPLDDFDFESERRLSAINGTNTPTVNFPIDINVYFHVINSGEGIANGDLPQSLIEDQIRVLNDDFKSTNLFNFRLAAVDRSTNATWFNNLNFNTIEEREMKTILRKGGKMDLNVYSVNLPQLLGWATFPQDYEGNPVEDGVVITHGSMPGGAKDRFNLGRTLTHEAGHWLGLYHTFEGGCSYPNDFVTDTIAQKQPTDGCPTGQKTCTLEDFPGEDRNIFERVDALATQDPIHNFMDYSDDACMSEFTAGQAERMKDVWVRFRHEEGVKA